MKLNLLVRVKNKAWWLAIIPALAILVQAVLSIFGISWDYTDAVGKVAAIVEAVFAVLVLLGVSVDPTTDMFSDSTRALGYEQPAPNAREASER